MDWQKVAELSIATAPATILALATMITTLRNVFALQTVVKQTNGMLQKIVSDAETKGVAAGKKEERADADFRDRSPLSGPPAM